MYTALVAGLTLLTGAAAELVILSPSAGITWFTNDTVPLNWTSTQPDIDPKQFRVLLSGAGMAGPQELANQVPTANEYYRISLPQVNPGEGYIVTFTNTTNTTQVFAKSNEFKIDAGTPATSTHSSSVPTASSANLPPNVSAPPTSSSANPFASASTKAGAAGKLAAPVVAAGAIAAAVMAAL